MAQMVAHQAFQRQIAHRLVRQGAQAIDPLTATLPGKLAPRVYRSGTSRAAARENP
jgi:hypothetical protein